MPMRSCEWVKQIHITRAPYASHAWWVHNFPWLQRSEILTEHRYAEKDLCSCYIKQIMNVFSFVQWNIYILFGKCSIQLGFASLNGTFSSFTSWKYLYHCTHKHSLFVYHPTIKFISQSLRNSTVLFKQIFTVNQLTHTSIFFLSVVTLLIYARTYRRVKPFVWDAFALLIPCSNAALLNWPIILTIVNIRPNYQFFRSPSRLFLFPHTSHHLPLMMLRRLTLVPLATSLARNATMFLILPHSIVVGLVKLSKFSKTSVTTLQILSPHHL